MTGITEEFIQEAKLIQIINKTYRKMKWIIAPKVIEEEYDRPNLKAFNLVLINNDIKNDWQIEALNRPLTSDVFAHFYSDFFDDMIYDAIKERHPEIEIDEETDMDEYLTIEEQYKICLRAEYCAIKEIAEKIIETIIQRFELNEDDEIEIYAGSTLLIKAANNIKAKKLTDEEKEKLILDATYFNISKSFAIDLYCTLKSDDITMIHKDSFYVEGLMQYGKSCIN